MDLIRDVEFMTRKSHTHTHSHTVRWSDWNLCGEYFPNLEIPTRVAPVESKDQINRSVCDKTKTMGLEEVEVECGALFSPRFFCIFIRRRWEKQKKCKKNLGVQMLGVMCPSKLGGKKFFFNRYLDDDFAGLNVSDENAAPTC